MVVLVDSNLTDSQMTNVENEIMQVGGIETMKFVSKKNLLYTLVRSDPSHTIELEDSYYLKDVYIITLLNNAAIDSVSNEILNIDGISSISCWTWCESCLSVN